LPTSPPIDGYGIGALADVGWVVGWSALMMAAVKPTVAELRLTDDLQQLSAAQLALPYAPLILAAGTALIIQIVTGAFEPFLVYTGATIGFLVLSRQIVDLIESRQLHTRLWTADSTSAVKQQTLQDTLNAASITQERPRRG
jgi:hypothetical protein